MKAYFAKELPDQALYLNGKAYRFEVMETEDQNLIRLLDSAIRKRIGGVSRITEQQYLDKKKSLTSQASLPKPRQREEVRQKVVPQPRFTNRNQKRNVAVSAEPVKAAALVPSQKQDISAFVPKASRGVLS